jgi:hypothetical protein
MLLYGALMHWFGEDRTKIACSGDSYTVKHPQDLVFAL